MSSMKAIYKCRCCGRRVIVPIFTLNGHDTDVLESGGWVSANLSSVRDALNYHGTIISQCDVDHYGLMDFVGFEPGEPEEE